MTAHPFFIPYLLLVLTVVGWYVVRGLATGDVSALTKGMSTLAGGIGFFIIATLVTGGHTAGAIAATAVIVPLAVGGWLVWFFVVRPLRPGASPSRRSAAPKATPPSAMTTPRWPFRFKLTGLTGIAVASLVPLGFSAKLFFDGHRTAAYGTCGVVILLTAVAMTVRQVISTVNQEHKDQPETETTPEPGFAATPRPARAEPAAAAPAPAPSPQQARRSTVETRFVRMTLDHGAGSLSGEIIAGPERGRTLDKLDPDRLMELLESWRQEDATTAVVVESWLDRTRPDWREELERPEPSRGHTVTREEALAILDLPADAADATIKDAHRRLMARVHPDGGGSTWLAAKVNEARDALLG
ncbi:MAG: hypothetical protein WCF85_01860 [Rhodospirillaceae bacterium]